MIDLSNEGEGDHSDDFVDDFTLRAWMASLGTISPEVGDTDRHAQHFIFLPLFPPPEGRSACLLF